MNRPARRASPLNPTLRKIRVALATTTVAALLAGCGGGGASGQPDLPPDDTAAIAESAAYGNKDSAIDGSTGSVVPSITVRAKGSLCNEVGPIMQVRVDDSLIGTVEVRNTTDWADYTFSAPTLRSGSKVEVVYTNDARVNGVDRNLFLAYLGDGRTVMLPTAAGAVIDQGSGAAAFDGQNLAAAGSALYSNGALRLAWLAPASTTLRSAARRLDAARFLAQASFGPTSGLLDTLAYQTFADWIDAQVALPATDDFVAAVQARYLRGDSLRPGGTDYTPYEVTRAFWHTTMTAPDQLRRRTAFALHQIFMISQADSNLGHHSRAYARYLDLLNRHALGNFRDLLEEMALSPAMGIYLSHMRNRKEDAATGRLPDENFAREVMQLFTIGLYELNPDGSLRLDASGQPIETYSNADVMALAKVFTGYAWAFPDDQLTDSNFRWRSPDYSASADQHIDLQRMKAYPGQHSTAEKKLFTGKPWAVTLPAGASAADDVRSALDTLFRHPNVGPFIGRQLIQRLVTSHPSPDYVARVAAVFANNGRGVRGDLAAVVRAILLDVEARQAPGTGVGKLREPVLRIAHWMRAFGASSSTGAYNFAWQIEQAGQAPQHAASVFGYFRPGYIPPGTTFASASTTAPEFQIVNENTVAGWVNLAESMASGGLGWTDNTYELAASYDGLVARLTQGQVTGLVDALDQLLLGGRMSAELRQVIVEAVASVGGNDAASQLNRVRMAVFIALASPEFLVQR